MICIPVSEIIIIISKILFIHIINIIINLKIIIATTNILNFEYKVQAITEVGSNYRIIKHQEIKKLKIH